ncbi:uncharacterized protein LOC106063810 [Biomphalaria glabrata]|uniref:Uncharacterized protein LOC106063810 n=1 Tax=Biomphalaria glabrata TaxID=6526 RepID=A0A9W2YQN3_BIOGL|nr:uncharacterized protein LOC106063810 [Biomphalaria glabrata]
MKRLLLPLLLLTSLLQGSFTELIIQVNPGTISPGLTPKLTVTCSISNESVAELNAIQSLSMSRYNETSKTFDVLYTIDKETLSLKQIVELKGVQISFGNLFILLTIPSPSQYDCQTYSCIANGYNKYGNNDSISTKVKVESRTNITEYIKEINRLKKLEANSIMEDNVPLKNIEKLILANMNIQMCSLTTNKTSEDLIEKATLHFRVNSKTIKELLQPMIMKCTFQVSKNDASQNFTVHYMYIRHETNGVLATISRDQQVGISQDTSLSQVQGQLSDQDFNISYLQVIWIKPSPSQSGKYVCGANIVNQEGQLEKLKASLEITIEKTSLDDLVPIVIDLLTERTKVRHILEASKKEIIEIKQQVRSAVIENVRLINHNSSTAFVLYSNIEFSGCKPNHTSQIKTLAMNCLRNVHCAALMCAKDLTCTPCDRSAISGLRFPDHGSEMYLKRSLVLSQVEKRLPSLVLSESIAVPSGLRAEDLIYFRVTLLKYDNFYIDLYEDNYNINYQFRARCDDDQCTGKGDCSESACKSKFVTINSKTYGLWSRSFVTRDYPFVLNEEYEMYLLIHQDSVDVYIKDKLFANLKTPRKPEDVRVIQFGGTIVLHELSL